MASELRRDPYERLDQTTERDDALPIVAHRIDAAALGEMQGQRPHGPTIASRLIYISLALVPLVLGSIVVLVRVGVIAPGGTGAAAPWDLSILMLAIATTLVMSAVVSKRAPTALERARGQGSDQPYAAWEFGAIITTAPVAVLMALASFAAWAGWLPRPGGFLGEPVFPPILASAAILVSTAPVAYFTHLRTRHVRAMEERFPDFLRDLNESYAAGMTMAQSIRVASRGDYGRLNPEIRRMAHQVSWGTPFPTALELFADRVGTPLVTRAISLIIKATRAGGNVKDVLAAAARDSRELKAIEADRRLAMALYVIVIYVAFGVFLAVTAALQGLLIPSVLQSTQGLSGQAVGALAVSNALTELDFRFIFLGIGIVQALGSGLVAGAMSEGSMAAGLKHSALMVSVAAIVLGILL